MGFLDYVENHLKQKHTLFSQVRSNNQGPLGAFKRIKKKPIDTGEERKPHWGRCLAPVDALEGLPFQIVGPYTTLANPKIPVGPVLGYLLYLKGHNYD